MQNPEIDKYISTFPQDVQARLNQLRALIADMAPDAVEAMAYGMPGYKLNKKPFIYFGGFKNHIGFYPIPSGVEAFRQEFVDYSTSKGGIKFPHDKAIPFDMIKKIIKFRITENQKA